MILILNKKQKSIMKRAIAAAYYSDQDDLQAIIEEDGEGTHPIIEAELEDNIHELYNILKMLKK